MLYANGKANFEPNPFSYNTPTFLNLIYSSHNHLPIKTEQTECSETSAHKIQMSGNNPEESIQHLEHGEGLKTTRLFLIHLCIILQSMPRSQKWSLPINFPNSLPCIYKFHLSQTPMTILKFFGEKYKLCNSSLCSFMHLSTRILVLAVYKETRKYTPLPG